MFSEEPLESNNKYVRRYLERYTCASNPTLQLTDVMSRLLERSHPIVMKTQKNILLFVCLHVCVLCVLQIGIEPSGTHMHEVFQGVKICIELEVWSENILEFVRRNLEN